ncbi:hypothetical protein R3P38DRAFT_2590165 [Favolaschia claudopus]|uniref:Uncharacterized protein n=1 Tax=Favolaschia claudopus TaxID=2862362 RepID=A0AAV9Z0N0_9AGAR
MASASSTALNYGTASTTVASTSRPAAPISAASGPHRPVTAFTNLPRPSTASVQHTRPSSSTSIAASVHAERRASIQRNLHPNDSSGPSSTSLSSPRKRKSGPPRPYSDHPAAPLADFASTPSGLLGTTSLTVFYLSYGLISTLILSQLENSNHIDPLDLSPRYSWKNNAELEAVQNALLRANLVFTVEVRQIGPIFQAIDDAFEEHCRINNIDFAPFSPVPAVKTPNTTAWVLLGPKGRSSGRTWVEDPKSLTRFTFTAQAITTSPFTHTPNHLAEGPCILIGISSIFVGNHTVPKHVALGSSTLFGRTIACKHIYFFPHHSSHLLQTFIKSRSYLGESAPLDLTLRHMPGSGAFSLTAWQNHLTYPFAMDEHIRIKASTVKDAAQALIAAVLWLCGGRPTGLKFKEILNEQFSLNFPRPSVDGPIRNDIAFFGLQILIRTADPTSPAVGKGPRNETVALAVNMLLADGLYWTERENHLTLRLHPSHTAIPLRSCMLRATGFLFLLHFIFIGPPIPVSPFLFSTIFGGRCAATKFDVEFLLRFMSPASVKTVKSFHGVPLDQPLFSLDGGGDIKFHFLVNLPEFDTTMIGSRRSQIEHDGIISTIISYLTLGTIDITNRPEFRILEDGFNMCVEAFDGQDRPHHILEWFATPCRQLIFSGFDRQIKSVADLLSHVNFNQANGENDPWGDNAETVELLKRFIAHYLSEPGHPTCDDGIFDALLDEELRANVDDPFLRPKLFLSLLTGSALVPIDPDWKLKCVTHDWDEKFPRTTPDGSEDYGADVELFFRACFSTFTITNNARLRLLLLCEIPEAGRDTEFGRFFHGALLGSRREFNSV